jgi:hypothetical protein
MPSKRLSSIGLGAVCRTLAVLTVAAPLTGWALDGVTHAKSLGLGIMLGVFLGLLSLLANIAYVLIHVWYKRDASAWLALVPVLQGAVLAGLIGWAAEAFYQDEHRAWPGAGKVSEARAAIGTDDPVAIEQALQRCAAYCDGELDGFLNEATRKAAHASMVYLLSRGANPTPGSDWAMTSLRACGDQLHSGLNSLAVSVVLVDEVAFELLLARSSDEGRQQAAWFAARCDRLDLLRRLIEAGVPLTMRARFMADGTVLNATSSGSPESIGTLLNAAASGAALHVGVWLLEERGFDAAGEEGPPRQPRREDPLTSLLDFAVQTRDSRRYLPFLDLLVRHGAPLDRVSSVHRGTALQTAIWNDLPLLADALITAGASQTRLTADDRQRLAEARRNQRTERP